MLKYKSKFYLKAKELRGVLESKHTSEHHYYYGAEPWVKWCVRHNETRFSPKLALDLYQLDQSQKLDIIEHQ